MGVKNTLNDFREFAVRGNVVDLAVGIIIGAAFTTIVNSLVNDIMMPPLGWAMGGIDFSNYFLALPKPQDLTLLADGKLPEMPVFATVADAKKAGVAVIAYGVFINACINFLIVSFAIFMLVRQINKLRRKQAETPAEPAAPPADIQLLTEIRDLLKTRSAETP